MERGPFCYADPARIKHDLLAAGFTDVEIETIKLSSRVNSRDAAQGFVFGSPFRSEIERRDHQLLTALLRLLLRHSYDGTAKTPRCQHISLPLELPS